jgi:hypothetical protein
MSLPNAGVNYTIPACLFPGYYLVRHEIIALHNAYKEGGTQFYPGCHQSQVSGTGLTVPGDLVAFPGAYRSDDAGVLYSQYSQLPYTVPGPKVFECLGGGAGMERNDMALVGLTFEHREVSVCGDPISQRRSLGGL